MMVRHKLDPEHARRTEDRSVWWLTNYYLQKFAVLWLPLIWLLTALGFGYVTPRQKTGELKGQIDSSTVLLQRQIDRLKTDGAGLHATHDTLSRDLTLLIRSQCLSKWMTSYDKRLVGLFDAAGNCIR